MESFLSILIFTFPGLVAYYWIQLFGITPTVKYQGTEILAISAILWIPVNIVVLSIYNISIFLVKTNLYSKLNLFSIYNMKSLNELSTNFYFLLYYVIASTLVSYFLGKIVSGKVFDKVLGKINAIRIKNGKASLNRESNVWDTVFSHHQPQIVGVSKIDNDDPNKILIGELQNVSRTYELEKNVVLHETSHWGNIVKNYGVPVEKVYVDVKTGMKIEIYNNEECIQAQNRFIQSQQES
ncbi:hypothetical protein [Bacillus thuringiensis]|uniref:hypothetical protein n=1 Tax=Bacillus thuringiensis TaxID=1428 RepID=UPI000BEC7915|nr:hypothetical protein [Bacillus thuringiensis]PEE69002.1 hypothetical protein COM73_20985 [Bacillus thuringiensis]